jgi:alpha-1,3-rhamnosyl/mannosyltransferase
VLVLAGGLGRDVLGRRLRGLYRPVALRASLRRARVILTVSAYLRDVLVRRFRLDPRRVRVVPYGVSRRLEQGEPRYRGTGPTILVVSALWPYKRVEQAVAAFAQATAGEPATLLIAGPATAEERAPIEQIATRLNVGKRMHFLGNVPHDALADVYASADALLYLSEIESFGLPVIEAMVAGVPVIARRIPAVAEVAGDAPLWIDEHAGADEAAAQLRRLLHDDELRLGRVRAGRAQAERFTWERAARLTADALRAATEDAVAPVAAAEDPPRVDTLA